MKKVILLTVLSLLVTFSYAQTQTAYTLTTSERDTFLNAHNAVRKAYGCNPMTWDAQLAADSASYAAQCKVNPLTHSNAPGVGENLSTYMASPKPSTWLYKGPEYHVLNGWYSEEKNWNCGTNVCDTSNGKMCGHLTQIVWCDTYAVGCGIAYCLTTIGGKQWHVQNCVCRYKGPGNYVGVHPLKPIGGASKCPATPTVLGPLTPSPPVAQPVAPVTAPKAPTTTPTAPVTAPKAPTTAPTTVPTTAPKAPTTAPTTAPVTAPKAPAPPIAPKAVGTWWAGCQCTNAGTTYACQWEPWIDSGSTWCCPNPQDEFDWSYTVSNMGPTTDTVCPAGKAKTYARSEETADSMSDLPMGAWIGIAIAIAVVIIIIIVVIIVVRKKKNDERV